MNDKQEIDPLGTLAKLDQATEALINLAPILASYFKKLRAEGFTRDEAFELVINFQSQSLQRKNEG